MFEYFNKLLHSLNIPTNTALRGKFSAFPYDSTKISNIADRNIFNVWAKRQNAHFQHFEISIDECSSKIKFLLKCKNESTYRGVDFQKLLYKEFLANPNYVIVKKGFIRVFDCNNAIDNCDLQQLLLGLNLMPPTNNQVVMIPNDVDYQDLNLMDLFPDLTRSLVIQAKPLQIVVPGHDPLREMAIVKGHTLAEGGKAHINRYKATQAEHFKLSQDSSLSPMQRKQHLNIATDMDFHKLLAGLASFLTKYFL